MNKKMLIDLIKEYSQEELVEKLISSENIAERDTIKGQLLAHADFQTVLKTYEDKPLAKLGEYLERFDVYNDTGNLNLFINLTEPRQEAVLLSKIDTLKKIKAKLLEYVRANESNPVFQLHSEEASQDESGSEIPVESKVQRKKGRK